MDEIITMPYSEGDVVEAPIPLSPDDEYVLTPEMESEFTDGRGTEEEEGAFDNE